VLDVDDAIWIYRGGHFAKRLAALSETVICGNAFLADWFSQYNANVAILPTAVDTRYYRPLKEPAASGRVIGWCGSRSNMQYLEDLQSPLYELLSRHHDVILRVVSDVRPTLQRLPQKQVEFVRWTPKAEVSALQTMSVGLMPLRDDIWCRGKCSYKMLTYMASGLPVVVSDIGMNQQVLKQGPCGFAARTPSDWVEALQQLLTNPRLAVRMGASGRSIVERHYSLEAVAPRFAAVLRQAAGAA